MILVVFFSSIVLLPLNGKFLSRVSIAVSERYMLMSHCYRYYYRKLLLLLLLLRLPSQAFSPWYFSRTNSDPHHSSFQLVIIIIIMLLLLLLSPVTGLFPLVLLSNQQWSPSLKLPVPDCNTFRIMFDVPSTAVFCTESTECFPCMASKLFFKPFVTIPVAPVITGITTHFVFHNPCIPIRKLLYLRFSASFCFTYFFAGITPVIIIYVPHFLFLIIIPGLST